MSLSVNSGPNKGRRGSSLPSHVKITPRGAVESEEASNSNKSLEAQYYATEMKLHDLEEELDVLIHSARSIREQRTKTACGQLRNLDDGTPTLDTEGQLVDDYLALVVKGNAVDEVIKKLKEECSASRFKCSVILSQIRSPSENLRQSLRDKEGGVSGCPKRRYVVREDTEDDLYMENSLADIAGVAGAFGGGLTYSTTFCTARGRLDIISWTFACFLWVMIDWAVLKFWTTLPRRRELNGRIALVIRSAYPGYGGAIAATMIEKRACFISLLTLGVIIPLVVGFVLLGVSVVTLNSQARIPDPGSPRAIKASGYYIVALLGFVFISVIWTLTAYPALRGLYQIQRFLPGLNDLHTPSTNSTLSTES